MDEEIELMQLFIKTCQAVRNPHNRKNRVKMAVPAAQWEMKFEQRLKELQKKSPGAEVGQ